MDKLSLKQWPKWLLIVILLSPLLHTFAQEKQPAAKKPLTLSLFNTGSQLPGSGVLGVFTLPVHPGICVGTEFSYNQSKTNQWFQTAKVGAFYHQLAQTAIQLYTEAGYRRVFSEKFSGEFRLGGGYLHAIPATEVFEQTESGTWEKSNSLGRPMGTFTTSLGVNYHLNKDIRLTLGYQFSMQLPFVREYVPLLPYTAIHAGVAFPLIP
jgi:outer membrane receptor protein involved in Fe transport